MNKPLVVSNEVIAQAADLLRRGGVVAFPTETVYGLGADAFNAAAVARVFEIKNRPRFDPLIVHIESVESVENLCGTIPAVAKKLMREFWPGALTLVLAKQDLVPDIVTAGLSTVAIRMPSHPVAIELIRQAGTPIAAPSANPFGYLSPTTVGHVAEHLGDKVDLILDAGPCLMGIESTILDLLGDFPTLLRLGGIPKEDIEQVIGPIVLRDHQNNANPLSPGQLPQHYSPHTPIKFLNKDAAASKLKRGLLAFTSPRNQGEFQMIEVMSDSGDLKEAAVNLFSCLHRLDKAGLDVIYVESVPDIGLGRAIMDRLRRASNPRRHDLDEQGF